MRNTNLKVTDGKRIMMGPVNNNFLSYNFFWLGYQGACWKAELISGLHQVLSAWWDQIMKAHTPHLGCLGWLPWEDFELLVLPALALSVLGAGPGLQTAQRACSSVCQQPAQHRWAAPSCSGGWILCGLAITEREPEPNPPLGLTQSLARQGYFQPSQCWAPESEVIQS